MTRLRLLIPLTSALALVAVFVLVSGAGAHDRPAFKVVADGLDNPRGLDFGPGGALFVAEAGSGGPGPCIPGPEGGMQCLGATGAVTRIRRGGQERVVEGLPSLAAPGAGGAAATGPHDVSLSGRRAYLVTGLGAPPASRSLLGAGGADLAKVLRFRRNGTWTTVADIALFEAAGDPDGQGPFTNPYAVLARGRRQYVVDAGGNSLLRVGRHGAISTAAVFSTRATGKESVPDSIAFGPRGGLFVGELTGGPFPAGTANVYRIVAGQPVVYQSGFTMIIDIAFDRRGNLYVLEFDADGGLGPGTTGALIRVGRDGSRMTIAPEGLTLTAPAGLAIGHGAAYVSNCGACPAGLGTVVRINLKDVN
jgi:hypothetical protein